MNVGIEQLRNGGDLIARIEAIGARLRATIRPVVESAAGSSPRPTRLGDRLGIDKSLSSRVIRALLCESDLDLVYRVPSPSGLRILLARARRAGIERSLLSAADAEVDRFQELIHATPGGMDAIHAHIAGSSREVREKREHVARQAAYKAMSFLLGCYCEALATTLILVPSEDGQSVDGVEIHQRIGIHRLRPHAPLALLSLPTVLKEGVGDGGKWIEPIGGGDGGAPGPSRFIMSEYCDPATPRIEVVTEDASTTFVLEEPDRPSSNLSVTTGFRIRNGWPRTTRDGAVAASRGYVLPTPCQRLVRTVLIAEDVYPGSIPEITFQLQNPAAREDHGDNRRARIHRLDLCTTIERLEPGPGGLAVGGLPQCQGPVSRVFGMIGFDPSCFRGYRSSIAYPVPLIEMRWTIRIPA